MNSKNSFKIGLDTEYRFPFNRNKWGVYSELNYSSYKSEGTYMLKSTSSAPSNPGSSGREHFSFTSSFSILEIPIGFRYYSFIDSKNSLFYNAAYSYNVLLSNKDDIIFDTVLNDKILENSELQSGGGLNFGIGYKYISRFGIEIRYSRINVLKIKTLSGSSKSISLLFKYKL